MPVRSKHSNKLKPWVIGRRTPNGLAKTLRSNSGLVQRCVTSRFQVEPWTNAPNPQPRLDSNGSTCWTTRDLHENRRSVLACRAHHRVCKVRRCAAARHSLGPASHELRSRDGPGSRPAGSRKRAGPQQPPPCRPAHLHLTASSELPPAQTGRSDRSRWLHHSRTAAVRISAPSSANPTSA